jgi:hypothetical protein
MHPPQALVDVVGVYGQGQFDSHRDSSPPLPVPYCEDTVSFRTAGATALSFYENSAQTLLSYLFFLSSVSMKQYSESTGEGWVKKGGSNLRPLGVFIPDKILLLVDDITAPLGYNNNNNNSSNGVWNLKAIIRYSYALRLCDASTRSDDNMIEAVNELAVIHLLHYRTKGDSGGVAGESLLENLLLGTFQLFLAVLPKDNENCDEDNERYCFALKHIISTISFWATLLEYIASREETVLGKILTTASLESTEKGTIVFLNRIKMSLCAVLLKRDHLPPNPYPLTLNP